MISRIPTIPAEEAATLRFIRPALRALAILWLAALLPAGCSSDKPKTPKYRTQEQRENDVVEHRIFYEGWLHPGRSN